MRVRCYGRWPQNCFFSCFFMITKYVYICRPVNPTCPHHCLIPFYSVTWRVKWWPEHSPRFFFLSVCYSSIVKGFAFPFWLFPVSALARHRKKVKMPYKKNSKSDRVKKCLKKKCCYLSCSISCSVSESCCLSLSLSFLFRPFLHTIMFGNTNLLPQSIHC